MCGYGFFFFPPDCYGLQYKRVWEKSLRCSGACALVFGPVDVVADGL